MAASKPAPTCLIVDEHPVVRAGIRAVLEAAWPEATIADAESVVDAPDALGGRTPDVVIVDPSRAGVNVATLVSTLAERIDAPIVIFTADGGARLLSEALKAGVRGYVRKDS